MPSRKESYSSTTWKRVPKDIFVGGKTFTMGAMDSVAHFNGGNIATLNIFEEIGLSHDHYTTIGCKDGNEKR